MAKRPGRVGRWILPAAGIFVSLTTVWALTALFSLLIGDESTTARFVARLVQIAGVAALVAGGTTLAGIAYLLLALLQHQLQATETHRLEQALRRQSDLLGQVSDGLMLSDRAKAVAFREKERDALRNAIQEDLAKQDWEAAYHLIDEMQRSFGYHAESERLRAEVDQRRRETILAKLSAEMGLFRELLNNRDWDGARDEAEKLAGRYPGHQKTLNLLGEIDEVREAYKRKLLAEFKQAGDRGEIDRGVAMLHELDQYLTPGEAAGLQESARGVFRAKLYNLGVQFSMAISERSWAMALHVGEEIVREFPNSRMAEEVRENIDALRQRATQAAGTA